MVPIPVIYNDEEFNGIVYNNNTILTWIGTDKFNFFLAD